MMISLGASSIFEVRYFRGRVVHLLRDDLFRLSDGVAGNKARKLEGLDLTAETCVASYGGTQSNSMVALSYLTRTNRKRFVYYTRGPIPSFLKADKNGVSNFHKALANGMEVVEVHDRSLYSQLVSASKHRRGFPTDFPLLPAGISSNNEVCWVPQGGACPEAELGCQLLAKEVAGYIAGQMIKGEAEKKWQLVVAAGTGTTALFTCRSLARRHPSVRCGVTAVATAGSGADLLKQMTALDGTSGREEIYPACLDDTRAHEFAKPSAEHLSLWREICSTLQVPFDLIYAPRLFEVLLESTLWKDPSQEIILYCCGGSEGNESQMARYRRAGLCG